MSYRLEDVKRFLRDVVLAVGVLEGEVELVLLVEQVEAGLGLRAWTALRAAAAVDVDADVLLQLLGVVEAPVARAAVRDEPRDLIGRRGKWLSRRCTKCLVDIFCTRKRLEARYLARSRLGRLLYWEALTKIKLEL